MPGSLSVPPPPAPPPATTTRFERVTTLTDIGATTPTGTRVVAGVTPVAATVETAGPEHGDRHVRNRNLSIRFRGESVRDIAVGAAATDAAR